MHADFDTERTRPQAFRAPWLRQVMDRIRSLRFAIHTPARVFDKIYRRNFWKAVEARSQNRSVRPGNGHVRQRLQELIEKYDVQTLLDLPCGDFHWMSNADLNGCTYIGGDLVPDIVQANSDRFAAPSRSFRTIDILKDPLPRAEMLLCRDLFVHLSTAHIRRALANIKRGDIRFLLTTHYARAGSNEDILTGGWRPVNFRLPPFEFPEPLEIVRERGDAAAKVRGAHALGKSLALWRVTDLPG